MLICLVLIGMGTPASGATPFDDQSPVQPAIRTDAPKPATVEPIAVPSTWAGIDANRNFLQAVFQVKAEDDTGSWDAHELSMANEVMSTLPAFFRSATKGLRRVKNERGKGVMGYVAMNEAPIIHITEEGADYHHFQPYLVHEMTHCFQMSHPDILDAWEETFWSGALFWASPKKPSVTGYGSSNPKEDMAESVRMYWQSGSSLKSTHPDRYRFIKDRIMNGVEFPDQKPN